MCLMHMQVEETTPFAPIARKEIGALAWHVVTELPMTKEQSAMVCDVAVGHWPHLLLSRICMVRGPSLL